MRLCLSAVVVLAVAVGAAGVRKEEGRDAGAATRDRTRASAHASDPASAARPAAGRDAAADADGRGALRARKRWRS